MIQLQWSDQVVPDFDGIFSLTGQNYKLEDEIFTKCERQDFNYTQDLAILCSYSIPDSDLCLYGCEAFGHGSIGSVVLANIKRNEIVWSMLSSESNPFSKIVNRNSRFLAISTIDRIFRFELPLVKPEFVPRK